MSPSRIILEVEQKFCSLARLPFTADAGTPHFCSLHYLGEKRFTDTYYDKNDQLSSAGLWVRQRRLKGAKSFWEAKIRQGGTFNNSLFEEQTNVDAIAQRVSKIIGQDQDVSNNLGLNVLAHLETQRKSWLADEQFKIVLDSTDFGHQVGEVELEKEMTPPADRSSNDEIEEWKQGHLRDMDQQIEDFMKRYHWAFQSGTPQGKLTAYFQRQRR